MTIRSFRALLELERKEAIAKAEAALRKHEKDSLLDRLPDKPAVRKQQLARIKTITLGMAKQKGYEPKLALKGTTLDVTFAPEDFDMAYLGRIDWVAEIARTLGVEKAM